MRIVKYIPLAGVAICELDDGEQVRVHGDSEADILASLALHQNKVNDKKAEKQAEKDDPIKKNLESKAVKSLPHITEHLLAVRLRSSVSYYAELMSALLSLED